MRTTSYPEPYKYVCYYCGIPGIGKYKTPNQSLNSDAYMLDVEEGITDEGA